MNTIIDSERQRLFCWAESVDVHWSLYRMPVVNGEGEPRKVVGLLGPGSNTRWYTPVHQRPNDSAG